MTPTRLWWEIEVAEYPQTPLEELRSLKASWTTRQETFAELTKESDDADIARHIDDLQAMLTTFTWYTSQEKQTAHLAELSPTEQQEYQQLLTDLKLFREMIIDDKMIKFAGEWWYLEDVQWLRQLKDQWVLGTITAIVLSQWESGLQGVFKEHRTRIQQFVSKYTTKPFRVETDKTLHTLVMTWLLGEFREKYTALTEAKDRLGNLKENIIEPILDIRANNGSLFTRQANVWLTFGTWTIDRSKTWLAEGWDQILDRLGIQDWFTRDAMQLIFGELDGEYQLSRVRSSVSSTSMYAAPSINLGNGWSLQFHAMSQVATSPRSDQWALSRPLENLTVAAPGWQELLFLKNIWNRLVDREAPMQEAKSFSVLWWGTLAKQFSNEKWSFTHSLTVGTWLQVDEWLYAREDFFDGTNVLDKVWDLPIIGNELRQQMLNILTDGTWPYLLLGAPVVNHHKVQYMIEAVPAKFDAISGRIWVSWDFYHNKFFTGSAVTVLGGIGFNLSELFNNKEKKK